MSKVEELGGESPRENFDDFHHAFTTIFIVLIGEDWNRIMYDCVRATERANILYFVTLIIIGNIILLNVFLAIILNKFQQQEAVKEESVDEKLLGKIRR